MSFRIATSKQGSRKGSRNKNVAPSSLNILDEKFSLGHICGHTFFTQKQINNRPLFSESISTNHAGEI